MAGPTTTAIRLAQCPRCDGYVFASTVGGVKTAADPAPVTRDAYAATLAAGRRLFGLATIAGRPHKLLSKPPGATPPVFDDSGAQTAAQGVPAVVAEHGCGAGGQDAKPVTVETDGPAPTVCEQWRSQGWSPPPGKCARDRGQEVISCGECDAPPFLAGDEGARQGTPEVPGHPTGTLPSPNATRYSDSRRTWSSPTAPAARPGPDETGRTAPDAAKPSPPTGQPTSTASAPSASTEGARFRRKSDSSSAPTVSGATHPVTGSPVADPGGSEASSRTPRQRQKVPGRVGAQGGTPQQRPTCDTCGKVIGAGELHWGFQRGTKWMYAEHVECP